MALALGCAEAPAPGLVDLEGPRRQAVAPGPWRVAIVAEAGTPRLFAAVGDEPPVERPLSFEGGVWLGSLPAAEPGTTLAYHARLGAAQLPADGPRTVPVVAPARPAEPAPTPTCAIRVLTPLDGARITAREDEAPQAGIQIGVTAVVEGLADGEPIRLRWGSRGQVAQVVAGEVAFSAVTVLPGRQALVLDGQPVGGALCRAEITVSGPTLP